MYSYSVIPVLDCITLGHVTVTSQQTSVTLCVDVTFVRSSMTSNLLEYRSHQVLGLENTVGFIQRHFNWEHVLIFSIEPLKRLNSSKPGEFN